MSVSTNNFKRYLTFDDVGLIPKYNPIASRMDTNISTTIHNKTYSFPFVPANMDTVISKQMVHKLTQQNGMVIYHRFCSIDEKVSMCKEYPNMYMSVGISDSERETIDILIQNGIVNYCIDVAHGHSKQVGDVIKHIWDNCPEASIIAGNVCTQEGYRFLVESGANIVKVGVGGGCLDGSTKVKMANGVLKPISEIKVGDYVSNQYGTPVRVLNVMNMGPKRVLKIIGYHNNSIQLTYDHLIRCVNTETFDEKWIEAYALPTYFEYLPVGDYYHKYKIIENNEIVETWDIEVDCPTHSFIANNMIVHNSACTTRMKTGFGVPQFSAIQECYQAKLQLEKEGKPNWLIADGGIKHPRDCAIAFAIGADMIMMGNIFAKTYESNGKKYIKNGDSYQEIPHNEIEAYTHISNGKIYSHYRGQASHNFMKSYYGDKKTRVAEGVDFYTECIGPLEAVLDEYNGSLRSSLTYAGASNLEEYKDNVEVFESTSSYMTESNHRSHQ